MLNKGKTGCILACKDEATSYLNDVGTECTASCSDKISVSNQCVKFCESDEYATAASQCTKCSSISPFCTECKLDTTAKCTKCVNGYLEGDTCVTSCSAGTPLINYA